MSIQFKTREKNQEVVKNISTEVNEMKTNTKQRDDQQSQVLVL